MTTLYQDPYFQDIPWEIFYDEDGGVIGVLYVLLPKRGGADGDKNFKQARPILCNKQKGESKWKDNTFIFQ